MRSAYFAIRQMTGRMTLRAVLLLAVGLFAAAPLNAMEPEPASPEVAAAIQQVIISQIDAFQVDDGSLALSFAVPQAKQIYETPDAFMDMVRNGYKQIYRPEEFSFVAAVMEGDVANQIVRVKGENGKTVLALYQMHRQDDGSWLIGGVQTLRVPEKDDANEPDEDSL